MKQATFSYSAFVKMQTIFAAKGLIESPLKRSVPTDFSGILDYIQQVLNAVHYHMMDVNIYHH